MGGAGISGTQQVTSQETDAVLVDAVHCKQVPDYNEVVLRSRLQS